MAAERYRVVEDLQRTDFGFGRDYTIEQWRKQAIEWCWMDENDECAEVLYKMNKDNIMDFIAEYWALRFRKVRADKKHFRKNDLEDFEDESLKEYYSSRFIPKE